MPDGQVEAWPLRISSETLYNLEDNLLLFFTGYSRSASSILKEQDDKSKKRDPRMVDNLHFVKELGYRARRRLEDGDLVRFAELMNVHWEHKKKRSGAMSNPADRSLVRVGAAPTGRGRQAHRRGRRRLPDVLRRGQDALAPRHGETKLREVRFRFDFEGTKCVAA